MTRIAVIISLFMAAACDVGSVIAHNGGPDGGGGGNVDSNGSAANCEAVVTANIVTGHHNAGLGCMNAAGCHGAALGLGTNAPEYSYAGTLYKDAAGTQPFVGGTVIVVNGGVTKKLVTDSLGNFYITPALLPAPANATTKASGCPDTTPMIGTLNTGGGSCNNCHKTGAGAQAPPIHLP